MESLDLAKFFPTNLAERCHRYANSFSVPIASMVSMMCTLVSALGTTTYVASPGDGQVTPTAENFLNVGPSGINKTGSFDMLLHVLSQTEEVLRAAAFDVDKQIEEGVLIVASDFPVLDNTATPAATIKSRVRIVIWFALTMNGLPGFVP